MNNKVNHQNLLKGLLMLLAILFLMPQGTQAQTYSLGGNYVKFQKFVQPNPEEAGQYVDATEAAAGDKILVYIDYDANFPQNHYPTGDYSSKQITVMKILDEDGLYRGSGLFTMPAQDVTVNAVVAAQEEYVVDLSTATLQVIPESMWILLFSLDKEDGSTTYNVHDGAGNRYLDLNQNGTNDLQVIEVATSGASTYQIVRLDGANELSNCRFALSYLNPMQYNSVYFKFPPHALQAKWISLSQTTFTYDGTEHKPTVTVKDGTTDVTGEFNVTYSNNKSAGEATVTVTAKTTSTSYTGSVSKTFTITPKKVTISGVKAKDKIYDGTTSAVIDAESAIIDGKIEGDVLTVNAQSVTAVFANAEAGKDKPVTVSGFTLAGEQAGNYTLSAQPSSVTGTIAPKPVTVTGGLTASEVTFKGITGYSVDASNVIIDGAVNNENLSIIDVIARLQNGSTDVCDLDYTAATIVIGVEKANNYVVAQQGNQATAEITASSETVENADGSTIETATTRVKNADGSITETTQKKVTGDDGSVTEKKMTICADGSIEVKQTTTDAEGYQSCIELSFNDDDSEETTLTSAGDEGMETVKTVSASHSNEDGSKTCTETVTETTKDAGGNVTEKTTATTESTTKTTENSDGSVTDRETVKTTVTDAAGNSRVTEESIRETTTQADGSSVENVSETPDLGDTYSLDEEGELTPDHEGAENDYTEIASDVSGIIQDNTDGNGGDAYEEDQVSVLLGGEAGAGNVWLNTNEETDAAGEVINQDASLTVKQTASAGGSGEASFDSNPSAQIAIGAGALTSGSNSGKQSDSDNFGSLSWNYSGSTLTIKGKGTMKQTKPWLKYKKKIKTVRINLGVTSIASNAFSCHTRLTKVHIANSVTNIGSNAFNRCNNLKSVTIASRSKLIKIGKGAFSGLKQRLTINLPSSVTHIGENAFNNCHAHTRVYVKVPHGKVLNVKINGAGSKPQVIKPNSIGKADITSCLFKILSNRKSSRALTLKMVDAVDDDDTGDDPDDTGDDPDDSGDDGDDSGDDGDDSGDDGDDSGSGSDDSDSGSDDSGGGGSAIVNENKAATTVTINYQTKKETDGGAATADVSGGTRVTAGNKSVTMIGGTVDKIIGGGTRGATAEQEDDEIEIVSGKEYKILRDGYIVLNFYTPDADITVNSIIFRRPGDANNDGYVDVADLVEMINAKNGHASERFNLANADIDRDGDITQDDIDAVVKLIMEPKDKGDE